VEENLRDRLSFTRPREDKTIVVGDVPVIRPIFQTIKQVFGLRRIVENLEFADTLEEAYGRLQAQDVAER
jgi:hypothetical protein